VNVGDLVVVRGHGLARISSVTEKQVTATPIDLKKDESGGFEIDPAQLHEAMRPVVSAAEARAAIAALADVSASDQRDVGERALAYRRALRGGELAAQVAALGAIYRRGTPEYAERQYEAALERAAYAELSLVLRRPRKALKAELRQALLGERPPASLALPDRRRDLRAARAPKLRGLRGHGKLAIDTALALGELDAQLILVAEPGVWFAYAHGDIDDDDHHVLMIHAAHVDQLEALDAAAVVCGEINSEGAQVSFCDHAMLEDREFVDETMSAGSGIHGDRCFVWGLGGDGTSRVRAADGPGPVVYVRVDFGGP
jgi:RNA polymerase-interacting CarD/CdnL/TRCF family regulator